MKFTFATLLNKYLTDSLSEAEQKVFYNMIASGLYRSELKDYIDSKAGKLTGEDTQLMELSYQTLEAKIKAHEAEDSSAPVISMIKRTNIFRVAAAAIVLFLLSAGGYFYFNKGTKKQIANTETRQRFKNDIAAPQTNKAVLTLSNGSHIVLDSAGNGSLAVQGNVNVMKLADGKIIYKGDATEVKYNTLTVPKGSKPVQLQLADGSKVWLNVASSITYPTSFVSKERKVQITGEAYFEVAHNAAMPFVVEKNDVSVQVLGTHFNVNTYDDEADFRITLLEGSVKVSRGNLISFLKPGQQAILPFDKAQGKLAQDAKEIKIVNADIDEVMSWKNGLFFFNGADIKTVMRQLARWYDVDIEYEGDVKEKFHVEMNRDTNVSNVFKILETTGGVHFKIEGNKITVMK